MILDFLTVGIGGFFGASARFGILHWVKTQWGPQFPAGTLVVNALGCLMLGIVLAWLQHRGLLTSRINLFAVVGILGGFTTFSAFSFDSIELMNQGKWSLAIAYVAAQLGCGFVGLLLGLAATSKILS